MVFHTPKGILQNLLHETIVEAAKLNPDYPCMFTLDSDVPNAGIEIITYKQFVSDVTRVAMGLQRFIPKRRPASAPQNVGILAKSEYNYAILWLACQFNNWGAILISPKNSREAVQHLLSISNATHVIAGKDFVGYARSLELSIPVVALEKLPRDKAGIDPSEFVELSDEEREFERNLPAYYLHTSGSTGHPKLVGQTHKIVAGWLHSLNSEGSYLARQILYSQGPLYHAFGTHTILFGPSVGSIPLVEASNKPFTGESTLNVLSKFKNFLDGSSLDIPGTNRGVVLVTVPSILVDIANSGVEAMDRLAKVTKSVVYGGAALPIETGDLLAEHDVNLATGYGTTELGSVTNTPIPDKSRTNGEWGYSQFKRGYNHHWIPTDDPNKNQLVIVPGELSPLVFNHENPLGFDTKDVWIGHPTLKGWYRHGGRVEDVTVLSNGEKTDNKQIQSILLTSNNKIAHVIVFGTGRSQNGLLISPVGPIESNSDFLNEIWPMIERMNEVIPTHSRIVKKLVLIEDTRLPFSLTDKGTVKEKITLSLYENRIARAYEEAEEAGREVLFPSNFEREDILVFLRDVLRTLLPNAVLTGEADLFEHGMDSLLAVRLRSFIVQLLQKAEFSATFSVPRNVVYDYPSLFALADYILNSKSSDETLSNPESSDIKTRVQQLVDRFTTNFNPRSVGHTSGDDGLKYVVVTGTTGSLGAFLLDQLLDRPGVKRIYCFNRKAEVDTIQRQLIRFRDRGLNVTKLQDEVGRRVILYDIDLTHPKLGLSSADYEEIRIHVTHIIHTAWLLNFKLRMEGFEKVHIAGVRHIIDLALSSPRARSPRFVFISSISTVARHKIKGGAPESPVKDESYASFGYGLSKLVGERITEVASEKVGLDAVIARIGQISGSSSSGAWARSEYNPILFQSCFGLGAVPDDLPPVKWIPVDVSAAVLLKQAFSQNDYGSLQYYHLENPISTPWSTIADSISQFRGANLPQISLKEWLGRVKVHSVEDADKIPVVRLPEFFENIEDSPGLSVTNTLAVAPEVNFGEITQDLMERYLKYQINGSS